MKLLITLLALILISCTSQSEGPGQYELQQGEGVLLNGAALSYISDGVMKFGSTQVNACKHSNLMAGERYFSVRTIPGHVFNTYHPGTGNVCFVDVFALQDSLQLSPFTAIQCGTGYLGYVKKEGGTNPYELHTFADDGTRAVLPFRRGERVAECNLLMDEREGDIITLRNP